MSKIIALTQGQFTVVDDEDYPQLMNYKWYAHKKSRNDGYYAARNGGNSKAKKIFMHREIMNTPAGFETDHINGNGLDNQKSNLRVCSKEQNQHNQTVKRKNTSSKYKGVSYYKKNKKWGVNMTFHGKCLFFGLYDSEVEAANIYNLFAIELFGEYASLNVIEQEMK